MMDLGSRTSDVISVQNLGYVKEEQNVNTQIQQVQCTQTTTAALIVVGKELLELLTQFAPM